MEILKFIIIFCHCFIIVEIGIRIVLKLKNEDKIFVPDETLSPKIGLTTIL